MLTAWSAPAPKLGQVPKTYLISSSCDGFCVVASSACASQFYDASVSFRKAYGMMLNY